MRFPKTIACILVLLLVGTAYAWPTWTQEQCDTYYEEVLDPAFEAALDAKDTASAEKDAYEDTRATADGLADSLNASGEPYWGSCEGCVFYAANAAGHLGYADTYQSSAWDFYGGPNGGCNKLATGRVRLGQSNDFYNNGDYTNAWSYATMATANFNLAATRFGLAEIDYGSAEQHAGTAEDCYSNIIDCEDCNE